MIRNHQTFIGKIAAMTAVAALLLAGSATAFAGTITWEGVTFETVGQGSAAIDSNGDLLLQPTGSVFALHTNRIPDNGDGPSPINANDTPYISFSYYDTGNNGDKIEGEINDEQAGAWIGAGSRGSYAQVLKLSIRNGSDTYPLQAGNRSSVLHTVLLGKTADGLLYTMFDGEVTSSDFFKNEGISYDFTDFYLRANNASDSAIRFTDLAYGNDFSPSMLRAVPEPGALSILALGLLCLVAGGLSRRRHASQAAV